MRPGEIFIITKGEHAGKRARLKKTVSFFCHVELLTSSGEKVPNGSLSLHRTALAEESKDDVGATG